MDTLWVSFIVCAVIVVFPLIERAIFAGMHWLLEDPQADSQEALDEAAESEVAGAELIYNLNRALIRGK